MASAAQIVPNVISKTKDYDVKVAINGGQQKALEYARYYFTRTW